MFDRKLRAFVAPPLDVVGGKIATLGVSATAVTVSGWVVGVGACTAVALRLWSLALILWLVNRLFDGLDGPVARVRGATERGGYLDVIADFSVYGGFILGVAIAVPDARLACTALLLTYYVSGTAVLALSSLLERRRQTGVDERSLRLVGGIAEGFETMVAYVAFCLLPGSAAVIAWVFSALVGITAVQRIGAGVRLLHIRSASRTDD